MPDASAAAAISVVIPTKDRADLLGVTLRSVREQTLPPAEVIVADDGSSDNTEEVVEQAGALLVRNPGGGWGAAGARNAGLETARSEFVSFLDSDDLFRPRALELLHAALSRKGDAPFAYGQGLSARKTEAGWLSEGLIGPLPAELADPLGSMFARNSVPSGGALVRTEVARDVGGYDRQIVYLEDHAFWLRLAQRAGPVHVPELVCIHRRHGGNRMSPAIAFRDDALINALADGDPRLTGRLPRRSGVQLCELAIDAIHRRRLDEAGMAARELLLRRPAKARILASAVRQFRHRRQLGREGALLLERDAELRDWLAGY